MNMDEIIEFLAGMEDVLTLRPGPGDGTPEIAWGDAFFYHSPDGTVPRTQPFATVVTKDYPDDAASRLDRPDAFRVNIAAGTGRFVAWVGAKPRQAVPDGIDFSASDVVLPHPVYGTLGWLCVVNPGPRTDSPVRELLEEAYRLARGRHERRSTLKTRRAGD